MTTADVKTWDWLKSMFEESPGVVSSVRVVFLAAFAVCIGIPLLVQSVLSCIAGAWIEIPITVQTHTLAAFAAATGAKLIQNAQENKAP